MRTNDTALLTLRLAFPLKLRPGLWSCGVYDAPRVCGAFEIMRDIPGVGLTAGDVLLYRYRPRQISRHVRMQPTEMPRSAIAAVIEASDALRLIEDVDCFPLNHRERGDNATRSLLRGLRAAKVNAKRPSPLHYLRPPTTISADSDAHAVDLLLVEIGGA